MPRGKGRRSPRAEVDASPAHSEAADDGETTAEETAPAVEPTESDTEVPAAKPRRRWNLLRRGEIQPEAMATEELTEESDESPDDTTTADTTTADTTAAEALEESAVEQTEGEAVLVPHRPAGRWLKMAAAAAAALFVAGGAFVGAMAQPVIANRALVETRLDIARTAADAITTLWSYTPENMDSLADRSARYLSGDLATQYRRFIDSIVSTNKQAQVTNTTSVKGAAVEAVDGPEASAIVYTNSIATSPVSKNIPSLRYLSYRLEMKRDRSDWRITRMTTITTLDLTPQL